MLAESLLTAGSLRYSPAVSSTPMGQPLINPAAGQMYSSSGALCSTELNGLNRKQSRSARKDGIQKLPVMYGRLYVGRKQKVSTIGSWMLLYIHWTWIIRTLLRNTLHDMLQITGGMCSMCLLHCMRRRRRQIHLRWTCLHVGLTRLHSRQFTHSSLQNFVCHS